MVKDRLKELQVIRQNANLPVGFSNGNDSDAKVYISENATEAQLLQLLEKIGPLYTRIKKLNEDIITLRKGMNDPLQREQFADHIADVKIEARSLFKEIQKVSLLMKSDWHLLSHVAWTHHLSLVGLFSVANAELANLQADIHERHKRYIEKELHVTGQEVSDVELGNLLDHPAEIFNQNLLQDTKLAKQSLLDIQHRHEEILKIEKSIVEVNSLFQELAMLVNEQGEKIDRIDQYVHDAKDRAEMARTELTKAKDNQRKARKKKFILIGILLVILLIVILIIIFSF